MNLLEPPDGGHLPRERRATGRPALEEIEIDPGAGRRWMGWIGYLLVFAAVCGLFVFLFFQFTGSFRLAIVLVGFLVLYMTLMGWWASKNVEGR